MEQVNDIENIGEKTSKDTFYVVDGSQSQVTLEIFINAPGQTCNTRIELDDIVKVEGHSGSFEEQPFETNASLNGKTMFIATSITNTSGHTAKAEVTIRLNGGQLPSEDLLSATHAAGETIIYTYICKFFKA